MSSSVLVQYEELTWTDVGERDVLARLKSFIGVDPSLPQNRLPMQNT